MALFGLSVGDYFILLALWLMAATVHAKLSQREWYLGLKQGKYNTDFITMIKEASHQLSDEASQAMNEYLEHASAGIGKGTPGPGRGNKSEEKQLQEMEIMQQHDWIAALGMGSPQMKRAYNYLMKNPSVIAMIEAIMSGQREPSAIFTQMMEAQGIPLTMIQNAMGNVQQGEGINIIPKGSSSGWSR